MRIEGSTITSDRVWNFGQLPAHVVGGTTINSPGSLTVTPGSVIKLGNSADIWANTGALTAIGTAADPIVFTATTDDSVGGDSNADGDATTPAAGDWNSLYLYNPDSAVSHADVRYGGRDARYATIRVDQNSSGTEGSHVQLSDLRITDGATRGVDIINGRPDLENIVITDHASLAVYQQFSSQPTYQGLTLRDNAGGDHISLQGGTINTDRIWDFDGSTAHLIGTVNINDPGSLTIAAGSVIKLNTGVYVDANTGPMLAQGTADAPIVFTATTDDSVGGDSNADGSATSPTPGHWANLFLRNRDTVLSNAELRFGGRDLRYATAWIGENNTGSDGSNVTLSDVRIASGLTRGIDANNGNPSFQNVVVTDHVSYAIDQAFASEPNYDGVTLRNNLGGDHIRLQGGTINTDRVWDFGGNAAHLTGNLNINDPGSLTVAPGSVIKMWTGVAIDANSGPLKAVGTEDAPIIFTATTDDTAGGDSNADGNLTVPEPGHWSNFFLRHRDTELAHAEIRYGGRDTRYATVYISENTFGSDGSNIALSDVRIEEGNTRGIDAVTGNPVLQNVAIADHASIGISQAFASQPIYDGVELRNNRGGDHVSVQGGTINTDRNWDFDGNVAHLTSSVTIRDPGSLTVAPGSVIKLGTGVSIDADTGPLKAIGTTTEPIVFTATTDDTAGGDSNADGDATVPSPGQWSTLFLRNGDTELTNVDLRYGGRDARYGTLYISENDSGSDRQSCFADRRRSERDDESGRRCGRR